uniref:POPDC1-3 domain-containing protein n=1 Tax=Entomoneis paludosa TaxID=265537 RepID=A0A7S3DS61_9STRA|mmetsp:Transcript_31959/g.66694  ORF Transcript_31959/g.66694 Transcript_31959/m.66694 type:complete len:440 (+) Transcript_31959:199-1518(+)|eukprot:CAMPEP_0172462348 /NCGR_PEP_ID=MMETSP1065-20121228/43619_1 /TAXON_ID=265537 /ORGANISM="Amphiprora paludosa, Strain CCMP125" /LENGTH=439 /DNA_ID=CAMNT_0013217975 /DNA_START=196 /DNA_END=1515 /DNA_ORIENTATION=-
MVQLLTPLSLWIQLASFFFFLSGIYGDLLVIRFFLVLAYIMLFINAVVGSPLWPDITGNDGTLALDSLLWAILSLYVHGCSLLCLLLDERPVTLTDDQAALWRMLYRTGGLSKKLFHSIVVPHLQVVDIPAGQDIDTKDHFYIIYKGQVKLNVFEEEENGGKAKKDPDSNDMNSLGAKRKRGRVLVSGEMFDLKCLSLFAPLGNPIFGTTSIQCHSLTPCKLFCISRTNMEQIAQHRLAKGLWQALLINQLSFIVETYSNGLALSKLAETQQDVIFKPLELWEEPKAVLSGSGRALEHGFGVVRHLGYYLWHAFSPPLPLAGHFTGLRQTQLPPPPHPLPDEDVSMPPRFHALRRSLTRRLTQKESSFNSQTSNPPATKQQPPAPEDEQDTIVSAAAAFRADMPLVEASSSELMEMKGYNTMDQDHSDVANDEVDIEQV